jgi:mitochondrial fission protein ELM1
LNPLTNECWIITEGAAGMESQCLGLAERLPLKQRVFRLKVAAPWRWFAPRSLGSPFAHLTAESDRPAPPWPRLVIGCGRQSIPFSIAIRRASAGRTITVQCQNPRVSAGKFDLVIPPEHDGLTGPHVFPIIGSPNRITPTKLEDAHAEFTAEFSKLTAPRVAVLIGGSSRSHGHLHQAQGRVLLEGLRAVAKNASLMITTSRRTDPPVAAALRSGLTGPNIYFWDGDSPNPYFGMLAWADAIVVTSDSVNMICEAAGTGKPVHIFQLNARSQRARKFQNSVFERGIARPFTGRIEQWSYAPLDETGRAAKQIQMLLDARMTASDMKA